MRVAIAGGGIGGLALAQGLMKQGVDVMVLERDSSVDLTRGYKLHLGPTATSALQTLLPGHQMDALIAASVKVDGFSLAVRDHRARLLLRANEPTEGFSLDVDRFSLRRILSDGLGDRLRLDAECVSYTESDDGVTLSLTDDEIGCDALVIADGSSSRLVQQLAGGPTCTPTGLTGIAGRTSVDALSEEGRALLRGDPMLAFGPGGLGLFASWHAPAGHAAIVIWGLIAVSTALPRELRQLGADQLSELTVTALRRRRWSEVLVELTASAQPASLSSFRLLAAAPEAIAPWVPRRVTAIGDAAHAMPPTGGQGAATAILDARCHSSLLNEAARNILPLPAALGRAVDEMRGRAATAVRESLQPIGWIKASAHPLGAAVTTAALPAAATVASLLRRVRGANRE